MEVVAFEWKNRKMRPKRMSETKKFHLDEKVEVRCEEEGFQGSWHQGTVIAWDKRGVHIRYDYIVVDDGSDNLVEVVDVSPAIVDIDCPCESFTHYRGSMRRLPPTLEFSRLNLCYGICVDVWYKEAWWEGVIFDHKDDLEKRRVFFPDLGDEMIVDISDLRITQDWDEFEEEWHQRGTWLFLELVEQYVQDWYISVSVEQLWYDLREKNGFRNVREWTVSCESLWKELVLEVIKDNHEIAVNHSLKVLGLPGFSKPESESHLEPTTRDADVKMSSDADIADTLALVPFENPVNGTLLSSDADIADSPLMCINDDIHVMTECNGSTLDKAACVLPEASLVSPSVADGISCISSVTSNEGFPNTDTDMAKRRVGRSRHNATTTWTTAGPDLVPTAESCPDAIREYANSGKKDVNALKTDVRKHLLYQGWKIEFKRKGHVVRMRYISPSGKMYYSLYKLCSHLMNNTRELICSNTKDARHVVKPNIKDQYVVEPEYCPQAVLNWSKAESYKSHKFRRSEMILKAKQHLSFLGWVFHYAGSERRPYLCYTSPRGRKYDSLREACKICIKEGGISQYDASPSGSVEKINVNEEVDNQLASDKPYSTLSNMDIQRKLICLDTRGAHHVVEPNIKDPCFVEPEYCPQAVLNWSKVESDESRKCQYRKNDMILKAKKHLSYLGWVFSYATRNGTPYLRYTSPTGRTCYSVRQACKICIEEGGISQYDASPSGSVGKINVIEEVDSPPASEKFSSALSKMDFQRKLICSDSRNVFEQSRVVGQRTRKPKRRRNDSLLYLVADFVKMRADLPVNNTSISRLKDGNLPVALIKARENLKDSQHKRVLRSTAALIKVRNNLEGIQHKRVLRSTKRVQQVISPSPSHQNPLTVLSWLIDNNVVLPRSKVHYWRKEKRLKVKGRITRNGVKCNCCDNIYTLDGFVAHGGSSNHRPAAKIFLEDGRSLLDCQREMMLNNKTEFEKKRSCRLTHSWRIDKNDNVCVVCHYGGDLILCDQCPSSFHKSCLGLESIPDGEWFCPSCCCGICGQSKLKEDGADIVDDRILTCAQCEHKYHVGCICRRRADRLEISAKENWFCCKKCEEVFPLSFIFEEIFLVLHELLGRPIPVGTSNLTWTLIKTMQSDTRDLDASDNDAMVENYSKLSIALDMMHECFKPVKEPRTGRDVVTDVIFSRSSELNRLNFQGFYTILLERNDELITVANVRVHGEKLAEIPLIGTRFQYRRLGMCRILMDELEKKLVELGVRRLILPALPNVLHAWTASFGFSQMSQSERLQFVDSMLLDFEGAIMCQKLLKSPLAEYNPTLGSQFRVHSDAFESGGNADADGSSSVSEALQLQAIEEENGFIDQGLPVTDAGGGISNNENHVDVDVVVMADRPIQTDHVLCNRVNPEFSVKDADFKDRKCGSNGFIKYYKRRRTSVSRRYGYPTDSATVNYLPGCS